MLKVLILYPYLPSPEAGHGSARVVSRILAGVARHAEITLVCAYRPSERSQVDSVRPLCHRLFPVERRFVSDMGAVRRISEWTTTGMRFVAGDDPLPVIKLHRPELRQAVEAALKAGPYDLVHVELSVMAQYARLWTGIPSVLVDHEAAGSGGEDSARWSTYVQEIYTRFDRILTLCEEDREDLLAISPGLSIEVRRPGMEVPPVVRRAPEKDRILFFGSPSHAPNRDAVEWMATEILPRIRKRRRGARLFCAGFEQGGGRIEIEAEAAGVEFLGFVEDLAAEIARAAVVLAPVRTGRGVRMKNLEAMAHGTPLVTTPLGARGMSALPDRSFLKGADAGEIADRVIDLLADPVEAEELGRRGRQGVAGQFTYEEQARITLEAWKSVAGTGSAV